MNQRISTLGKIITLSTGYVPVDNAIEPNLNNQGQAVKCEVQSLFLPFFILEGCGASHDEHTF